MSIDIADRVEWDLRCAQNTGRRPSDDARRYRVRLIVDAVVPQDAVPPRGRSALAEVADLVLRFAGNEDSSDRLERAVEHCALVGVDLEAVLAVVIRGIEDTAIEQDVPDDEPGRFLRVTRTATVIVARVYGHTRTGTPRRGETPQDVAAALLRGETAPMLGWFGQITIAHAYWLLAVRVPAVRAVGLTGPGPRGAAGPPTAGALAELRACFGPDAVALLADAGGTILIPADDAVGEAELGAFVDRMSAAIAEPVLAVAVRSATGELPAADEQAHAALEVAGRLSLPDRLYRFAEVAIDFQLTRPGPGRDALAAVLAPIEEHPDLLETLRAYLEHGQDRRRTARALHLHPNSVDYRLRRIYQLTGTDGVDPAGLWTLRSALTVRDFLHGAAGGPVGAPD